MFCIKLFYFVVVLATCISTPVVERRFLIDDQTKHPPVKITQANYTAAVFYQTEVLEYLPRGPGMEVKARKSIFENLNLYEQKATIAGQQGVDILVFPEYGLLYRRANRTMVKPFLENVPDPMQVTWNPCIQPALDTSTEIQQRLSCMARNHSLYIVANMGAKQACPASLSDCPSDGQFQYNTDVVFDPNGTLIARYHKRNVFVFEKAFDKAPVELVTFDTLFGRFAVFSSFDSVFKQPAIEVIEKFNVDSVAFPTLVQGRSQFLLNFEWEAGFAVGMKVNVLAAGLVSEDGGGIFTPTGAAAYDTGYDENQQLIIATIPSRPVTFPNSIETPTMANMSSDENSYQSDFYANVYNLVQLEGKNGTVTVCQGTFCCQAQFDRQYYTADHQNYSLGAFSGRHWSTYFPVEAQICVLTQCGRYSPLDCFFYYRMDSTTRFTSLKLTGNFSTSYVFPEVLFSHGRENVILSDAEWTFSNNVLLSHTGFSKPLKYAVLFSRDYPRDVQIV